MVKQTKRFIFSLIALTVCCSLSGCSFSFDWFYYLRARRALAQRDYKSALTTFHDLIIRQPDSSRALTSARIGARVAHLESKTYPLAVEFYKHIVLRSEDADERKRAQAAIAQIYFENLLDYDQSVIEYERLLTLQQSPEEAFKYRLNLAKSHFHLNNLDQATNEIDILLAGRHSSDDVFEAKILKANVLVAGHRLADAALAWEEILKEFPDRSKKENVALNLVVCYEELKDFGKAIEVLERMKVDYPNPDFLNLRIERLKERKSNQPGAQGLKR